MSFVLTISLSPVHPTYKVTITVLHLRERERERKKKERERLTERHRERERRGEGGELVQTFPKNKQNSSPI